MERIKKNESTPESNNIQETRRLSQGLELDLSQEEIEKFDKLLDLASGSAFSSSFTWEHMYTFETLKDQWSFNNVDVHQEILGVRKQWFEMKKAGDAFRRFFENKFKEELQESKYNTTIIYNYISVYKSLGYEYAPEFLAKILNQGPIWKDTDGSNMHVISEFLERAKTPETSSAIIQLINNIFSPEYQREEYRDNDLWSAVNSLHQIVGEKKAKDILAVMAEKDATFSGWLEKRGLCVKRIGFSTFQQPPLKFDTFNAELEAQRIKELESSISTEFLDEKEEFVAPVYKKRNLADIFGWGNYNLEESAASWESRENSRLINFYGRFTPQIEGAEKITQENYLKGLYRTVAQGREDIFNFINGMLSGELIPYELPETPSIEDAWRMAALGYARALVLIKLEKRRDEAFSEISVLRDYLEHALMGKSGTDADFISALLKEIEKLNYNPDLAEIDLPKSAEPFLLYHATLKKSRFVPNFHTLLSEKIKWLLSEDLFQNIKKINFVWEEQGMVPVEGPSFRRLDAIANEYNTNLSLYKSVEEKDTPVYWEAKEKLEDFGVERAVVFGRDGKYFFTALKAGEFGQRKTELKYVVVTTPMISENSKRKEVLRYLQEHGIALDFTFIDTGFRGSVPEAAIKYLADAGGIELSSQEVDKRIMLLSSSIKKRRHLSKRGAEESGPAVELIEARPKNIGTPASFMLDKQGRLKPTIQPLGTFEQLGAWTTEHAVWRNFAPRLDAEKRLTYLKKDPLEGYKFIQDFQGSLGTHPFELWESEAGKKVLLKGGPSHTVRADFVGQQFLKKFGIPTPETKIVFLDEGIKLMVDFLEGWKGGEIKLPPEFHKNSVIQRGFLVDMLLGQYDRTPWNFMFKNGEVRFIDNGGCLFSRARGGYKGFSDHFDINELAELLSNPQFQGEPVNEAYHNLVEVKNNKIIVKDNYRLHLFWENFRTWATESEIEEIIDVAGFSDGPSSINELNKRIEKLKVELTGIPHNSKDYKMISEAIETFKKAIVEGGEAAYLKKALLYRYKDIINLFKDEVV